MSCIDASHEDSFRRGLCRCYEKSDYSSCKFASVGAHVEKMDDDDEKKDDSGLGSPSHSTLAVSNK